MINRECHKVPYFSRGEAKKAVKVINRKYGNNNLKDVYSCDVCGENIWHTTSSTKEINRAKIKEKTKDGSSKTFTRYQNKGHRLSKGPQES